MNNDIPLVKSYFPELSQEKLDLLSQFSEALLAWNTKINLISRKDTEHFETHHLLSSLAIYKEIKFPVGSKILDIGTGGGLPGIPLAICFPECEFHLVDSIGKKIKVVNDIIQQLELPNVTAEQVRAETISQRVDFVTGRAVTALEKFIALARSALKRGSVNELPRGIVYLKGQEVEGELITLNLKAEKLAPLAQFYEDPFFEEKFVVHVSTNEIRRNLRNEV